MDSSPGATWLARRADFAEPSPPPVWRWRRQEVVLPPKLGT